MSKNKKIALVFATLMLFVAVVAALYYAVKIGYLSPQMALLLLICLLGMYVGFGILFGAYRLVNKLH